MLGGTGGGLSGDGTPRVVAHLLDCRKREIEITICPQIARPTYIVEWQVVRFDPREQSWVPVQEWSRGDPQ